MTQMRNAEPRTGHVLGLSSPAAWLRIRRHATVLGLWIGIAVLLITGCRSPARGPRFDPRSKSTDSSSLFASSLTNRLDPNWLKPSIEPYRLGPGDRMDIEIIGSGDPSTSVLVGPDGRIYFHLLPALQVWGLTLEETAQLIERELVRYLRTPKIGITLREVESKRVWVLGRVNTPGIYPLSTPTTVLEAVTKAGGLFTSRFSGTTEELADLHHSFIVRRGAYLPVNFKRLLHEGDTSQNIYLQPDDFVYLPSALASEVHILGAVYLPRAIAFKDRVTLTSAIAGAGGLRPTARMREIVIIRGALSQPSYATVNLQAILQGKASEIVLQPRDIIYVPDKPLDPMRRMVSTILDAFVRTVAANEGLRAGGVQTKVGVGISVGQ